MAFFGTLQEEDPARHTCEQKHCEIWTQMDKMPVEWQSKVKDIIAVLNQFPCLCLEKLFKVKQFTNFPDCFTLFMQDVSPCSNYPNRHNCRAFSKQL